MSSAAAALKVGDTRWARPFNIQKVLKLSKDKSCKLGRKTGELQGILLLLGKKRTINKKKTVLILLQKASQLFSWTSILKDFCFDHNMRQRAAFCLWSPSGQLKFWG